LCIFLLFCLVGVAVVILAVAAFHHVAGEISKGMLDQLLWQAVWMWAENMIATVTKRRVTVTNKANVFRYVHHVTWRPASTISICYLLTQVLWSYCIASTQ
jgi:hypothetical protein